MSVMDTLGQTGAIQSMARELGDLLGGGNGIPTRGGAAPGLASMLDLDGDGNPLDDILNMAGKLMR